MEREREKEKDFISSFGQEMNHFSFIYKHLYLVVFTLCFFFLSDTTFPPLDSGVTDGQSEIKNKQPRTDDGGAESRQRPEGS